MKTTKIISACAVLVALASCSNDQELSQQSAEDTSIRIQANVGGIATRAGSNLLASSFSNGDAIKVFITENTTNKTTPSGGSYAPMVYTLNQGQFSAATTQYFPSNGNGIDVWGVYPSTVTESTTNFTIAGNQTNDAEYKNSDLMVAQKLENKVKGNPITLSFSHKLSKIIVKLEKESGVDGALDGAVIKLTNVVKKTALAVSGSGINLGALSEDAGDKGELTIGNYIPENGTAAIVIPQTTNTMQFKVTLANGGSYTANMPDNTTEFETNKEYTYTLRLKANGISVSAVINPWSKEDKGTHDAILD